MAADLFRRPRMEILLPAVGIALSAFCVWLTVRIVNRRERWAKWTLGVLVAFIIGYPTSSGPARSFLMWRERLGPGTIVLPNGSVCTWKSRTTIMYGKWSVIYAPIDWAASQKFGTPIRWYLDLFQIPEESRGPSR
jgi:hypothetical protein